MELDGAGSRKGKPHHIPNPGQGAGLMNVAWNTMDLGILNRNLLLLLYCSLPQICAQLCQTPCFCSWIPPRCPPGVPIIVDGCGCCRICARQLGESCDRLYLCDESKELLCDYPTNTGRGTCNYDYDGGCEYDGKEYEDGEVFQPNCKFQCKCLDGGVTCTPLCSENVLLATPECPSPRRVQVPGRCCPEWICNEEQQNSLGKETSIVSQGGSWVKPLACREWSTQWSACSVSCGLGVSLRVSNRNLLCRLETQVRLCIVRPCRNSPDMSSMTGAACTPTVHSEHRLRYKTDECISLREFKPIFCGICPSRRCVPYQTHTETVAFRCRGNLTWKRMMSIISCVCY